MEVNKSWHADFHQPLGRVWKALTADSELGAWFDPGASLQIRDGGELVAPSGTQFRGKFKQGKLLRLRQGRELIFDWPLGDVSTDVLWTITPLGQGARLVVNHRVLTRSQEILPPRTGEDALGHFWFQNLACLKYRLETGLSPTRADFSRLPEKEVDVALEVPLPPEELWAFFTEPKKMDRWVSKKAVVDLKKGGAFSFGWDHGAERIVGLSPGESVMFNWHYRGSQTLVTWSAEPLPDPSHSRAHIRHVGFEPQERSTLYSYNEGWLGPLYSLGIAASTKEEQSWFGEI